MSLKRYALGLVAVGLSSVAIAQSPVAKSAPASLPPLPTPVKSAPISSSALTPSAPAKPVSVASPLPLAKPVSVTKNAPTAATALPKPMPATPKADRAERVAKMMKGLVPVSELTAGIDQLTAEDLRTHPALVTDLIVAGSRSTCVPVRLSTVQALVRCGVKTPEAMSVLQTAAQTDPESAVRTAAMTGLKK